MIMPGLDTYLLKLSAHAYIKVATDHSFGETETM